MFRLSLMTYTSFYACHVISHGVQTGLCWVYLDDRRKLMFASFEFLFPIKAHGLAEFKHQGLRVGASVNQRYTRVNSSTSAL